MSSYLDFEQSPIYASPVDVLVYETDTESYGGSPINVVVAATNLTTKQIVTASIVTGSATVSGDVITWPSLAGWLDKNLYRIDLQFTCGVNTFRRSLKIKCLN